MRLTVLIVNLFQDNLKAIRIQPSIEAYRNYDQERVHTSGHGRTWTGSATTEVLRWVYLRAISNAECAQTFGGALINVNAICAQYYNMTSQSTCQGDSGGPLVHIDSNGVDTLIGVTSFVAGGDFGCHSGLPAGFIRAGPFLSWFKEISGIDFENIEEEDDETDPTPPITTTTEYITTTTVTSPPPPPTTTQPPDNSEEIGGGSEEDDSTSEESSEEIDYCPDDDLAELLKRIQINVKVKVAINKFNMRNKKKKDKKQKEHLSLIHKQ